MGAKISRGVELVRARRIRQKKEREKKVNSAAIRVLTICTFNFVDVLSMCEHRTDENRIFVLNDTRCRVN